MKLVSEVLLWRQREKKFYFTILDTDCQKFDSFIIFFIRHGRKLSQYLWVLDSWIKTPLEQNRLLGKSIRFCRQLIISFTCTDEDFYCFITVFTEMLSVNVENPGGSNHNPSSGAPESNHATGELKASYPTGEIIRDAAADLQFTLRHVSCCRASLCDLSWWWRFFLFNRDVTNNFSIQRGPGVWNFHSNQ